MIDDSDVVTTGILLIGATVPDFNAADIQDKFCFGFGAASDAHLAAHNSHIQDYISLFGSLDFRLAQLKCGILLLFQCWQQLHQQIADQPQHRLLEILNINVFH